MNPVPPTYLGGDYIRKGLVLPSNKRFYVEEIPFAIFMFL